MLSTKPYTGRQPPGLARNNRLACLAYVYHQGLHHNDPGHPRICIDNSRFFTSRTSASTGPRDIAVGGIPTLPDPVRS
jgi:hypothetical protein